MNELNVVLGAGFSKPAGLPLAAEIRERFDRNQIGKLLSYSSGEWFWIDDKDRVTIHNGQIGNDHLIFSYILNSLIEQYKLDSKGFLNYEHFFNYLIENLKISRWYDGLKVIAKQQFYTGLSIEKEENKDIWEPLFKQATSDKMIIVINYLIADLLSIHKINFDSLILEYEQFIDTLLKYDKVNIFTLNHDNLLERLLSHKKISFSRGFSLENTNLYYEKQPLPIFNSSFNDKINIFKLHGSVDFLRYEHFENDGSLFWKPTGLYNYFTTGGYRAKHYAVRVNPDSHEVIQDMNYDVSPKFITGTNKDEIIKNDIMFTELFNKYEENIARQSDVLISGYSFSDSHINIGLQRNKSLNIINQNPSVNYPFEALKIENIKSLKELR